MQLQVEALCRHDEAGRLVAWNGPPGEDPGAPLFFLGRTAHGSLWRFHRDLPDELVCELGRLAAAEAGGGDLEKDPDRLGAIRDRIELQLGATRIWRGPAFRFPAQLPDLGSVEWLEGSELEELEASFPALEGSTAGREPCAVVRDGGAIASACYATTCPAAGAGLEAGVDTRPEQRGRGLAARVVAAWAGEVRRREMLPLYSSSWDNRASRAVARKLGLALFGSDLHFRNAEGARPFG
jgi:hypothetical protein